MSDPFADVDAASTKRIAIIATAQEARAADAVISRHGFPTCATAAHEILPGMEMILLP